MTCYGVVLTLTHTLCIYQLSTHTLTSVVLIETYQGSEIIKLISSAWQLHFAAHVHNLYIMK